MVSTLLGIAMLAAVVRIAMGCSFPSWDEICLQMLAKVVRSFNGMLLTWWDRIAFFQIVCTVLGIAMLAHYGISVSEGNDFSSWELVAGIAMFAAVVGIAMGCSFPSWDKICLQMLAKVVGSCNGMLLTWWDRRAFFQIVCAVVGIADRIALGCLQKWFAVAVGRWALVQIVLL